MAIFQVIENFLHTKKNYKKNNFLDKNTKIVIRVFLKTTGVRLSVKEM